MSVSRRPTWPMWVSLLVLLSIPIGVTLWNQQGGSTTAPDFTLHSTGYENGTEVDPVEFSLSDYRGQVVLLDFMAVTCTSCRVVEDEVLVPLHDKYRNESDFVLLSIDVWAGSAGETEEELRNFQMEHGHPWRYALDDDNVVKKYSAISLPKIVVVDRGGEMVLAKSGIPSKESVDVAIQGALAGTAPPVSAAQLGLFALALVAGLASFFAPCSIGLIPAYMGFLIQQGSNEEAGRGRFMHTLRGGALTGIGIVSVYAVLAVILWAFGEHLRPHIPILAPIMAGLLILFGLFLLTGVSWDAIAEKLGMGRLDGRRGFFAFGLGYGLAAFGCTGPIFLPILLAGFLEGAFTGAVVFAIYALSIAGFMFLAAFLIATSQRGMLEKILSRTQLVSRISAVLLIGAGAYLLWFYSRAYGWFA